jgi:hypothetical protein
VIRFFAATNGQVNECLLVAVETVQNPGACRRMIRAPDPAERRESRDDRGRDDLPALFSPQVRNRPEPGGLLAIRSSGGKGKRDDQGSRRLTGIVLPQVLDGLVRRRTVALRQACVPASTCARSGRRRGHSVGYSLNNAVMGLLVSSPSLTCRAAELVLVFVVDVQNPFERDHPAGHPGNVVLQAVQPPSNKLCGYGLAHAMHPERPKMV